MQDEERNTFVQYQDRISASTESVEVQRYRSKYVDLLKKERSEHEAVLER